MSDDHMRSLIHNDPPSRNDRHARTSGPSIHDDGRRKVLKASPRSRKSCA
ncbi:hypothetical protein ACPA9J_22870 [Pseudomonas aeruginosa]